MSLSISPQWPILLVTTLYHLLACHRENQQQPPGQLIDVGGYKLHLSTLGEGQHTIVLDHSLGGLEGYLLLHELAQLGHVVICDRAGYGWSDHSPHPRTSHQIVTELQIALRQADIPPPYILVGDSFGSYNMRLYAHQYPDQVQGLVLTDGLHEQDMLNMPSALQAVQLLFLSGFIMSILGASLGLIRLLRLFKVFELIKPPLRHLPPLVLHPVTRSFCRPKHWITMTRELWNLRISGKQLLIADSLGALPLVSIEAESFFLPTLWSRFLPLNTINQLRQRMHRRLRALSTACTPLDANHSSHFVWIDRPDILVKAVAIVIAKQQTTDPKDLPHVSRR